jgi:general transcription factor 3C polypeptide 5 (transcription factor C subunit 1)
VHLFKSCLPYVAYSIAKGPFRKLWIRFGYDPKLHPESAIYQTIHFRVSTQVVKDVSERYVCK